MPRVALFCELYVIDGYMDELIEIITKHSKTCLEVESGCLLFQVTRDRDRPELIRIYEEYHGQEDLDKHNSTERYTELNAKIEHMLSEVIVYTTDLLS